MEAQMTNETAVQTPATVEKKPLLKRIPKWAIYSTLALIVAAILGYGYTQQWFKFAKIGTGSSATETLSSTGGPAAVANAQEAVVKARQAFASGDVRGAINGYQEVLAANPNDFGTMGELANVYYMTGWIPHATQMYFQTASKAIEQNRPDVAEALLPVIIRGNPMLASQLQDRMFDREVQQSEQSFNAEQRS